MDDLAALTRALTAQAWAVACVMEFERRNASVFGGTREVQGVIDHVAHIMAPADFAAEITGDAPCVVKEAAP